MWPNSQTRRWRGVTLIEAGIILVLISMLAAFISSVTMRARRTARALACVSNLRQIASGLLMYQAKYGYIPLPQQPALPETLSEFIHDESVFVCPATPHETTDSYSRYFVPRNPSCPTGFILGCPNHGEDNTTVGVFGGGRAVQGQTATVTWNGKPVKIGTEVQGGTLVFADGTKVEVDAGLKVVVLASFDEGQGRIYSAIRIPLGAFGAVRVEAAPGTHFDVATPACTAGVRGTKFAVNTSQSTTSYITDVSVTEGVVAVEYYLPEPSIRVLEATPTAPAAATYSIPKTEAPLLTDATIGLPQFKHKETSYKVTNDGTKPFTISTILHRWPCSNGKLTEVKLGGKKIYGSLLSIGNITLVSGWLGTTKDRTLKPGETKELEFEYSDRVDRTASAYLVRVLYANDGMTP